MLTLKEIGVQLKKQTSKTPPPKKEKQQHKN